MATVAVTTEDVMNTMRRHILVYDCDGDATWTVELSSTLGAANSYLIKCVSIPDGTSPPDDQFHLYLNDTAGVDAFYAEGIDLSDAANGVFYPQVTGFEDGPPVMPFYGTYSLQMSDNTDVAGEGVLVIYCGR